MSLRLFARAEAQEGYHYELANGVVEVTDIPGMEHNWVLRAIVRTIMMYDAVHPGIIEYSGGASEAKIELWHRESERHPDLSVYLTAPPADVEHPWDRWIPEIVVEVISPASARRDLKEKPDDYLAAGVQEYWIIDPRKRVGFFLVRHGDLWVRRRVTARGKWKTPLLPGFVLEMAGLFPAKPRKR